MGKVRDIRFDALKGFLILSVVFGHFFTHDASHGVVSQTLANFIYSYHMPLFVFVSGYFTNSQNPLKGILRILETYIVFQLIKGLWYRYSLLWLFIMPSPMLWYLFALILWRLLYAGLNKIGIKVTPYLIGFFVILSIAVGFIPWVGRQFALSRFIFFAPYFFLGVYTQKFHTIDFINRRFSTKMTYAVLLISLLISALFAIYSIGIKDVFSGTIPYPLNHQWVYMIARIVSYFTSIVISIAFIRIFSIENKLFGTIGRDSLKYYMFHGLCLMAIEAVGAPWSTLLAIAYATIVVASIFILNKTVFSDFLITPVSFMISRIKTQKIKQNNG